MRGMYIYVYVYVSICDIMGKITYKNLKLVIEELKGQGFTSEVDFTSLAKALAVMTDIVHPLGIKQAIKSMETIEMLRYRGNQVWEIVER